MLPSQSIQRLADAKVSRSSPYSTSGANEMGAVIAGMTFGDLADVLPTFIVDGLLVGIGARVGTEIDKAI